MREKGAERSSRTNGCWERCLALNVLITVTCIHISAEAQQVGLKCASGSFVAAGAVHSTSQSALRLCCSGQDAVLAVERTSGTVKLPCSQNSGSLMSSACCFDASLASGGDVNVVAAGGITTGMGDAPQGTWAYLVKTADQYLHWFPDTRAPFIDAQRECQASGGLLYDIPQASVAPNVRAPASEAAWEAARVELRQLMHGMPLPLDPGDASVWLGALTYSRNFTSGVGPGFEDACQEFPVWEASALYDRTASGVNSNAFGSCMSATLGGGGQGGRSLATEYRACDTEVGAVCMKQAGFGRIATGSEFIQTSQRYSDCTDLCNEAFQGRLVNAKSRFTRQLAYSLLKTASLAQKRSLVDGVMRLWAGAYMEGSGKAAKWFWRGSGDALAPHLQSSGWWESSSDGAPAPAWFQASDVESPENLAGWNVSLVGQYENYKMNREAFGFPSCPYADEDTAYVKSGVLYDWTRYSEDVGTYEYPCACEEPAKESSVVAATLVQCPDGVAALGFVDAGQRSAGRGAPTFGGRCLGFQPAELQAWRMSLVQDPALSGFKNASELGACRDGSAISEVRVSASQPGTMSVLVHCDGEGSASNLVEDWTAPIVPPTAQAPAPGPLPAIPGSLARPQAPPQRDAQQSATSDTDSGETSKLVAGVAGGAAGLAVLIVAGAAALFAHRRHVRRQTLGSAQASANGTTMPPSETFWIHNNGLVPSPPASPNATEHNGGGGQKGMRTAKTMYTTDSLQVGTAVASTESPRKDAFEQLDDQLDLLAAAGPFLGVYYFQGILARRRGGQGIVQFASGPGGLDYALKFYIHEAAFYQEQQLYSTPALRSVMPPVHSVRDNVDGRICDSRGERVPPFVAVEKGESLNEWAKRRAPDFPTALTVLCHVADRLQSLHEAGLAHRDLKPENVLWLPSRNEWTLIDFGCAARLGEAAPLSYSIRYAAPETIIAAEADQRSVTPSASVDAWALGVVAYELLTLKQLFGKYLDAEKVAEARNCLAGRAALPWEQLNAEDRRALGSLRRTVLALLAREPESRATVSDVLRSWHDLFSATTTYTAASPGPQSDR